MKKMKTDELVQFLAENPDESAYSLLVDNCPNINARFQRACKTLKDIITDVRKQFPEATYYTASGGLLIVLGDTHSADINCHANRELSAISAMNGLVIGDGDW